MAAPQSFPEMFSLKGKIAVVTGAARGLGLAMAAGLAETGAEVVLADRLGEEGEKSVASLKDQGRKAHFREVDVADRDGIFSMMNEIAGALGGIDILINNAGVGTSAHGGPFAAQDIPVKHWRTLMSINLDGVFWGCQAAHPHIKARGGGSIINISSVLGLAAGPSFPAAAYGSAKAGVANLTRQLAVEWARDGIRVNSIAPGIFKTDIGGGSDKPLWGEAFQAHINERMPLQRIGMPEELKGTAIFLASEASCLVTGHILPVDGGWLAW